MKKRIVSLIVAALTVSLIAGCAQPQRKVKVHPARPGVEVITYPADLRGAYILPENGQKARKFCAEPPPDVALESLQKLALNLSARGATVGADTEFRTSVIELAGRSQLVLLAREMLYRACELSVNNPGSTIPNDLYDKIIELIEKLGTAEESKEIKAAAEQAERLLMRIQSDPKLGSMYLGEEEERQENREESERPRRKRR